MAANPGEVTNSWADYDIKFMQELTFKDCRSVSENTTGQLIDARDNKAYWVTKLKDGNCWMTQNLDYNGGGIQITDLSLWDGSTSSGHVNNSTAAYYDPEDATYGNYYSWEAAKTVCPSGWAAPSSNSTTTNGSFGKLTTAYGINSSTTGSATLRAAPLNFVYGGAIWAGSLHYTGERGYYWSSTANGDRAHFLNFGSNYVKPSDSHNRDVGMTARCLVQGS